MGRRKSSDPAESTEVWLPGTLKKRLKREAQKLNKPLSRFIAERLAQQQTIYMAKAERDELVLARFQLHKIGADIAQMAGAMTLLSKEDEKLIPDLTWLKSVGEELKRTLDKLDQLLVEIQPVKVEL